MGNRFELTTEVGVIPAKILDTKYGETYVMEGVGALALLDVLNELHRDKQKAIMVANDAIMLCKRGKFENGNTEFGEDEGATLVKDLIHNLNQRLYHIK